jgi:hypothetical protein
VLNNRRALNLLLLWQLFSVVALSAAPVRDYLGEPAPFTAVRVIDVLWTPRLETNRQMAVWYDFK